MNKKFIYAFSPDDSCKLMSAGYRLIKADTEKNIYVFENSGEMTLHTTMKSCVMSDMLTF